MSSLKVLTESSSSISSLPVTRHDIPAIPQAVQHLRTLEKNLKYADLLPAKDNPGLIKSVIEAILELEAEAGRNHELLEIETMKTCVLRNRLQVTTQSYEQQKRDDGRLAKSVNKRNIFELRSGIKSSNTHTRRYQKEYDEIQAALPLYQEEREHYRKIMYQLTLTANEKLGDKSGILIDLRTAKDRQSRMHLEMEFMDEAIVSMFKYLEFERGKCARQIREIRNLTKEKKKYLKKCRASNEEKLAELAEVEKEMQATRKVNQRVIQDTIAHDTLENRLGRQLGLLNGHFDRRQQAINGIKKKQKAVKQEIIKKNRQYEIKFINPHLKFMEQARERLQSLQGDFNWHENQYDQNVKALKKFEAEIEEQAKHMIVVGERMKAKDKKLEYINAKITDEKEDMETAKKEFEKRQNSRKASMKAYEADIFIDQMQLKSIRRDRLMSETRQRQVKNEQEKILQELQEYKRAIAENVKKNRQLLAELQEEETNLKEEIRQDNNGIEATVAALEEETQAFLNDKWKFQEEMNQIADQLEETESAREAVTVYLEAKENFDKIDEVRQQVVEEYEAMTQEFCEQEAYVTSLQKKKRIMEITIKKPDFKEEYLRKLKDLRQEYHEEVMSICCDVDELERQIFGITHIKGHFDMENAKWKQGIETLEKDYSKVEEKLKLKAKEHSDLDVTIQELQEQLDEGARTIEALTDEIEAQEKKGLQEIEHLEHGAGTKANKSSEFYKQLEAESAHISKFLSSMRTKKRESSKQIEEKSTKVQPSVPAKKENNNDQKD